MSAHCHRHRTDSSELWRAEIIGQTTYELSCTSRPHRRECALISAVTSHVQIRFCKASDAFVVFPCRRCYLRLGTHLAQVCGMAGKSLADRVAALEAKVGGKSIEAQFREQAELIDRRFDRRIPPTGGAHRQAVRLPIRGTRQEMESAVRAKHVALRRTWPSSAKGSAFS